MSSHEAIVTMVVDAKERNVGYWLSWRRCALCDYVICTVVRAGSEYADWKRFVDIETTLLSGWGRCEKCGMYTHQKCIGLSPCPEGAA